MKYNVKLKKISSNHRVLAREITVGWTNILPKVGERFSMACPTRFPDSPDPLRMMETTVVKDVVNIERDGRVVSVVFNTQNSSYQLDMLYYYEKR